MSLHPTNQSTVLRHLPPTLLRKRVLRNMADNQALAKIECVLCGGRQLWCDAMMRTVAGWWGVESPKSWPADRKRWPAGWWRAHPVGPRGKTLQTGGGSTPRMGVMGHLCRRAHSIFSELASEGSCPLCLPAALPCYTRKTTPRAFRCPTVCPVNACLLAMLRRPLDGDLDGAKPPRLNRASAEVGRANANLAHAGATNQSNAQPIFRPAAKQRCSDVLFPDLHEAGICVVYSGDHTNSGVRCRQISGELGQFWSAISRRCRQMSADLGQVGGRCRPISGELEQFWSDRGGVGKFRASPTKSGGMSANFRRSSSRSVAEPDPIWITSGRVRLKPARRQS